MAYPTLTASQIITTFELLVSDVTELSSSEELSLLNRVYQKICTDRPFEFSKKASTGTLASDTVGSYITVPADFAYFVQNNQFTDNTMGVYNNAVPRVIFIIVDNAYIPYQIINYSDRRQYLNRSGFAYLDIRAGVIRFTGTVAGTSYEFDYIAVPDLLTLLDTPIFPGRFHDMIAFGMAVDNDILQLSPKATSYLNENNAKYESYMKDLQYWNAMLLND